MAAVAKISTVQEINQWINKGLTYREISDLLLKKAPESKGLSMRSVRRFCKINGIGKKCALSKEELHKVIFEKQQKVNNTF